MSVNSEKATIEEIFKNSLAEAKKKKEKEKKQTASDDGDVEDGEDSDWDDKNKSIDGEEDGEEEENTEKKKIKKMKKDDDMKEETLAASSLHPAARPAQGDKLSLTKSKIGMMQHMLGHMNNMSKGDLTDWFTKTIDQFGPNKNYGVGDNEGKNKDSIDAKSSDASISKGPKTKYPMPKINVREDVDAMFDGQDLSEEFKENVSTIFEAAIGARLIAETARLEEEYENSLNEQLSIFTEELTAKLDIYLDYIVENWMKENEVAIESSLRNELMDDFINGLQNLFAKTYINIPEEKVNVLETLADKINDLEIKLDESITENVELKKHLTEKLASDVFEELASDLVLTQQEKYKALVEGISFDGDIETYTKKLKIVKENYFKKQTTDHVSNINEETYEGEETETKINIDPVINRYVQALTRSVKK